MNFHHATQHPPHQKVHHGRQQVKGPCTEITNQKPVSAAGRRRTGLVTCDMTRRASAQAPRSSSAPPATRSLTALRSDDAYG